MNQDSDTLFSDMTSYELVDLTISIQSANFEAVAIYLSVLSAYLVTAYLAAKSLTRFQLYSISTIYSVFMLMQLVQFVQLGNLQRNLVIYTTGIDNFVFYQLGNFITISAWLTSLVFMHRARNRNDT